MKEFIFDRSRIFTDEKAVDWILLGYRVSKELAYAIKQNQFRVICRQLALSVNTSTWLKSSCYFSLKRYSLNSLIWRLYTFIIPFLVKHRFIEARDVFSKYLWIRIGKIKMRWRHTIRMQGRHYIQMNIHIVWPKFSFDFQLSNLIECYIESLIAILN